MNPTMTRGVTALVVGIGMVAGAGAADAAPIVQTLNFGPLDAAFGGTNPASSPLSFNQFDTALGTLTSIEFSLSSTPGLTATINFSGGEAGSASGSLSASFVVGGPNGDVFSSGASAGASCNGSYVQFSYRCTATNTSLSLPTFSPNPLVLTAPVDFVGFTGTSTFNLTPRLTILTATDVSGCTDIYGFPASCSFLASGSWSGSLTVTYNYEPVSATAVPEPMALALLGGGLLGLGAALRRRQDNRAA